MSDNLIYTDDDARGLEYEYRGPVNMELPPARPAAYGVAGGVTIVVIFLAWLLSPAPQVTVVAVLLSPGVGILVARKVMRHVDYYRPVRYWTSVARLEVEAPRTSRAQAGTVETTPSLNIFKEGRR